MEITRDILADLLDIEKRIGYNCRATIILNEGLPRLRARVRMATMDGKSGINISMEDTLLKGICNEELSVFVERARQAFGEVIGPKSGAKC